MPKPVIGINCDLDPTGAHRPRPTASLFLNTEYIDAIQQAGGHPLPLPFFDEDGDLARALAGMDGLLLTGGGDLDPALYGASLHPETKVAAARRLRFDMRLARLALAGDMPVLGICMGIQLLNVAAGGTLVQHIPDLGREMLRHRRHDVEGGVHEARVVAGSRLEAIVGSGTLEVNSTHHQAVDCVAPGFRIVARAPDGVVEGMERPGDRMLVAVQWHPERLTGRSAHAALFRALVAAAAAHR